MRKHCRERDTYEICLIGVQFRCVLQRESQEDAIGVGGVRQAFSPQLHCPFADPFPLSFVVIALSLFITRSPCSSYHMCRLLFSGNCSGRIIARTQLQDMDSSPNPAASPPAASIKSSASSTSEHTRLV